MHVTNAATVMRLIKIRLHCIGKAKMGGRTDTFAELQQWSSQFANFLKSQGCAKGDRVSGLLPGTVELLVVILGAWRIGAVYQPLFTAFGPKAIEHRLHLAQSKLVISDMW